MRPDDWREQAECRDDPAPDRWFVPPGHRHDIAAAKAVCARCPVTAECLAEAMADPSTVGVWGGLDEQQRARMHKERKTTPDGPREIRHGTPYGARTHRKRGEEPCGPCAAAAKAESARDNERRAMKRRYERASA